MSTNLESAIAEVYGEPGLPTDELREQAARDWVMGKKHVDKITQYLLLAVCERLDDLIELVGQESRGVLIGEIMERLAAPPEGVKDGEGTAEEEDQGSS